METQTALKKEQFSPVNSLVRLVVYFKDSERTAVNYSLLNEDKKGNANSIKGMQRRLIEGRYRGMVKTAIYYNNITGNELKKDVF